jgi:hypothetical protein
LEEDKCLVLKSKQVGNNIDPGMGNNYGPEVGNYFDPGLRNNIGPKLKKVGNNYGPRQISTK